MERLTIQVGTFEVNSTILTIEGNAWIVDPGNEGPRIVEIINKKGLVPAGILLTHAHFDHIGAIPKLKQSFSELPVYLAKAEEAVFAHPLNQLPPDYPAIDLPSHLMNVHDLKICEVIDTPGHTPGGVCYYFPNDKLLLSGDTLFAGSIGRTDLPGGNMAVLIESVRKLMTLPEDTLVIPGHGPHTTIGNEKRSNPFIV